MPEFIVHVGPHKTGTTYLQLNLKDARPVLRDRGIYFPDFWDHAPGNAAQLPLVNHLRAGRADLLKPRFAEFHAGDIKMVILTAEDITNLEVPALVLLRDLIGDNPVKIVFYLRRWSELVPSSWQESVKHGHSFSLAEFTLQHISRPDSSRLLNFDLKLARLAEVFGMASLKLVAYSELRERGRDMYQHFAVNFLAWHGAKPLVKLANANASRDPREIELLRRLNSMARSDGEAPADKLRGVFDRMRGKLDVEPLLDTMKPYVRRLRFNDDWPVLRLLHEKLLTKYYDAVVRPKPPRDLFRVRAVDLPYVSPDYVVTPESATALQKLLSQLMENVDRASQ
jgi:hypothetical protein